MDVFVRRLIRFAVTAFLAVACFVGCAKPEPQVSQPGFLEQFPGVDGYWLEAKLAQTQADGIFLLRADGCFSSQRLGQARNPSLSAEKMHRAKNGRLEGYDWTEESVFAQLKRPLILVEPGTQYQFLIPVISLCDSMRQLKTSACVVWNQGTLVNQSSTTWASHTESYPNYGVSLYVETGQSSSGFWHFRWGNPRGSYTGSRQMRPPLETEYPWTEVESQSILIQQLKARFELDKVIHFRPDDKQSVESVLEMANAFLRADFLYVKLGG